MLQRLTCALALICFTSTFVACGGDDFDDGLIESSETQELRITAADVADGPLLLDVSSAPLQVDFDQTQGPIDLTRVQLLTPDQSQITLDEWLTAADPDLSFEGQERFAIGFPGEAGISDTHPIGEQQQALCGGADSCYRIVYIRDENGNVIGWVVYYFVRIR